MLSAAVWQVIQTYTKNPSWNQMMILWTLTLIWTLVQPRFHLMSRPVSSFTDITWPTMQDHVRHQASIISRAPNRAHFMESLRLMEDLMQQGSDLLAKRDSVKPKQVGGTVLDGPIPRPGGSGKRERSRGERRRGKKAKRNKSTRSRSSNEVRGIIIHAVIALTHTQLCECYHVGGDVIAYAACRADPNATIRITRPEYVRLE